MESTGSPAHVAEIEPLEDGQVRDSPAASETRATAERAGAFTTATEYEQALEDMGHIVNSSDNAFKRKHGGVIWKNLTVSP